MRSVNVIVCHRRRHRHLYNLNDSDEIWYTIMICDKKGVYGFYFASCMNIIFNELLAQLVKYDVYTTRKIKHRCHIFIIYYFHC